MVVHVNPPVLLQMATATTATTIVFAIGMVGIAVESRELHDLSLSRSPVCFFICPVGVLSQRRLTDSKHFIP